MDSKALVKRWFPPALLGGLRRILGRGIYFSGHYPDWSTAAEHASGYDAAMILERVKQASLKVRNGEAKFERDSVLFDEVQHSFPVLAGLLRAAMEHDQRLSVLDFGGALGSSYFQCRGFLSVLPAVRWGVVEQQHFVRCGQECFANEQLQFYFTNQECLAASNPNVALLSSVLQYLPDPYAVIDELMDVGIQYIVIDRTPFADIEADCITVQHVPPSIYSASYPCRIFAKPLFLARMHRCYDSVAQFDSNDGSASAGNVPFNFSGMIFRKR